MTRKYHSLSAGDFAQDWSNQDQFKENIDWSGVPSIIGFLGDVDAASPSDVDRRKRIGENLGVENVTSNQTAAEKLSAGGDAKFNIADPTVALHGSGTADTPSLVIYLDTSGLNDVHLTFNARDVDGSKDNAAQQLGVQYRIGDSDDWINIGDAADVTTGGSATQVTPFDIHLPEEANGHADLQVRILTTNAKGSDEWVGIDDIKVTSNAIATVKGQSVGFAPSSVHVFQNGGNSGATDYTFTVERSGRTDGEVSVSGSIASDETDEIDFHGGTMTKTSSGEIAAGADSFVFCKGFGHDMATDFAVHGIGADHDVIEISTSDFADFAALVNHLSDTALGVTLTLDEGATLTLTRVTKDAISAEDFNFAV